MLNKLVESFAGRVELPIEVDEIVDAIKDLGWQDEIYLFPVDSDPTRVRGAFRQFTYQKAVYGEPQLVTHIVYSKNVSLAWQRVISVKELVHIYDSVAAKTDTEEEVSQLLDRLVGPLSSEDYGLVDLQAAKDRLALYQALPLLLPKAALKIARENGLAPELVAERACMPIELVSLILSDEWQDLNGVLYYDC